MNHHHPLNQRQQAMHQPVLQTHPNHNPPPQYAASSQHTNLTQQHFAPPAFHYESTHPVSNAQQAANHNRSINGNAMQRPGTAGANVSGGIPQQNARLHGHSAQTTDKTNNARKQFKNYLTLLFQDLCTKESGLAKPYIRFYTFLKYTRMPSLLARRLFEMMANEEGIRMSSQADSQNGADSPDEQQLEKVVERIKFTEVMIELFFGTNEEKMDFVFRILDLKGNGQLDHECLRIFLVHVIATKREKHYTFLDELFNTYPSVSHECFKLLSTHQLAGFVPSLQQPSMREAIIDDVLLTDLFLPPTDEQVINLKNLNGPAKLPTVGLQDFMRAKPLLYNLMLEHLYLFLPCAEQYFKLIGELTHHQVTHSYAQQSVFTAGRFTGYGESALVKKLTTYSKNYDCTTGKQCGTGPAGVQLASDMVRQGGTQNQRGPAIVVGITPPGSHQLYNNQSNNEDISMSQNDRSKSIEKNRGEMGVFPPGSNVYFTNAPQNFINSIEPNPFTKGIYKRNGTVNKPSTNNVINQHPIMEHPYEQEGSDIQRQIETQKKQLQSQKKQLQELKMSLNNQECEEGEAGDDCGEFGQEDTRSELIINVPHITLSHSNFERMKSMDFVQSELPTLRIPLQRPRRNMYEHSRCVSKDRFESLATYSQVSRFGGGYQYTGYNTPNYNNYAGMGLPYAQLRDRNESPISVGIPQHNNYSALHLMGHAKSHNHSPVDYRMHNNATASNLVMPNGYRSNLMLAQNLRNSAQHMNVQQVNTNLSNLAIREEVKIDPQLLMSENSQISGMLNGLQALQHAQIRLPPAQKPLEGWVYFKFSQRTQGLERFFISIQSSDLYCYENDQKKKAKFMHSLIGCFPVDYSEPASNADTKQDTQQPTQPLPFEEVEGQKYWRIEVKLSQIYKRVFFLKTLEERDMWMKRLNQAAKIRRVTDEYEVSETVLGQGSYGKVLRGKSKATGEVVAVKQINKKGLQSEEIVLQMNEIDILRASSHPHVIRLLDFFEDARQFSIVLEFLDGRDLFGYLESRLADELHIRGIVGQLSEGMDYLHNQLGVMHRDIKMENILVISGKGSPGAAHAKIIDFGLALVMMPHEKCYQAYGTLAYCSPEIIHNHPHTKNTDVWSFGIVVHVMLTLRLPFLAHHKRLTSKNIVSQKLTFDDEIWGNISEEAKDLVNKMLDKNQQTRISVRQILTHPWLINPTLTHLQKQKAGSNLNAALANNGGGGAPQPLSRRQQLLMGFNHPMAQKEFNQMPGANNQQNNINTAGGNPTAQQQQYGQLMMKQDSNRAAQQYQAPQENRANLPGGAAAQPRATGAGPQQQVMMQQQGKK